MGNIPRSMSIFCRGEVTRQAQPGDHVSVTGVSLILVLSCDMYCVQCNCNDEFFYLQELTGPCTMQEAIDAL